jgi:P pilus assembly chaperone PapD
LRLLLAALALLVCSAPAASAATVQLRGTAYEFNNTDVRLAGAAIRVAERPKLRATTRRDGSYC